MGKDERRTDRLPWPGPIQVVWEDSGHQKFARAKCLDISEQGVRIECPEPIALRSYVVLRAEQIKLTRNASVRHCSRLGGKYIIGLEFSNPLKELPVVAPPAQPEPPPS